MTILEQWELINYISNKDYGGNVIGPDEFNALAKIVNLDLFKIKMGLPEDYQLGMPMSRQYLDATQRLTDETRFLKVLEKTKSVSSGIASYPTNYFGFDSMRYLRSTVIDGASKVVPHIVDMLTEDEYADRAESFTKQPTTKNPVCVIRNDGIHVYPISIVQVEFAYIKYPTDPNFDYNVSNGVVSDGGNSVQYEWGKHLHMDLTRMILGYMGINIRDEQLQQYAELHKQQGV